MIARSKPFDALKALTTVLACLRDRREDVISKRQSYAADPSLFVVDIGTMLLALASELGLHSQSVLATLDDVSSDWYRPGGLNESLVAGMEAHLGHRQARERARKMLARQGITVTHESSFEHLTRAVCDLYHLSESYGIECHILHQVAGHQFDADLVQAGRLDAAMQLLAAGSNAAH